MEKRDFQTPFGVIPLWADFDGFDPERPLVLGVLGAFAIERGSLFAVPPHLKGVADMAIGHLPGNHTPPLIDASVGLFSAAYSHVIREAFPDRRIVSLGASIGGLTVMGLRAPQVLRAVVMEPILTTAKLWPMTNFIRGKLLANPQDAALRSFIVNVFGVTETGIEDRRYDALLDGLATPTRVLVGDQPLYPERAVQKLPSLVDEPERERLARHPWIQYSVATGAGHNVPQEASGAMMQALMGAIRET